MTDLSDQSLDSIQFKTLNEKKPKRKAIVRFGQRKLLLGEVAFLNQFGSLAPLVIYIGAAPGKHILYLAELFPKHSFHLYDPKDFDNSLFDTSKNDDDDEDDDSSEDLFKSLNQKDLPPIARIKVFQQLFTDEDCEKYKSQRCLFISDIRQAIAAELSRPDVDKIVENDMKLQKDWVLSIEPKAAMFKFRAPRAASADPKFTYLKGEIFKQPWSPRQTHETRLFVCQPFEDFEFDTEQYRSDMNQRNGVERRKPIAKKHKINLKKVPGLCYCLDCNEEIEIWRDYLMKTSGEASNSQIANLLNRCSTRTKRPLGRHKSWRNDDAKAAAQSLMRNNNDDSDEDDDDDDDDDDDFD